MDKKKVNYLIGKAELLTSHVPPPKINPENKKLYSVKEIQDRLLPKVEGMIEQTYDLKEDTCPKDYIVSALTLHPSFIAKSFFPTKLLREIGAKSIGSKNVKVRPDKWKRTIKPEITNTTQLFIAFQKSELGHLEDLIKDLTFDDQLLDDFEKVWNIDFVEPSYKIKHNSDNSGKYFEIGLHLLPSVNSEFIKQAFLKYAEKNGITVNTELSIEVSNLWFVPCIGDENKVKAVSDFMFIRVIRPIPHLRIFNPLMKSNIAGGNVIFKKQKPVDANLKVAILDGGLPDEHVLEPWVKNYRMSDIHSSDYPNGTEHGLAVTSAFLFGPLNEGEVNIRPYSYVDHYRILDESSNGDDEFLLYSVLKNVEDILISRQYQFINLSVGPDVPIDDDEIHPWTALIDNYLADGETFLAVAAGNNGERDTVNGYNRISVPSDSINAISVGACSTRNLDWKKTGYSAIGPGRSPGRIKPDLLAFGGSTKEYFHVPHPIYQNRITPQQGTSFASPYLMRTAVGIKAILGEQISILAIKALLVHHALDNSEEQSLIGWGKVPEDINDIIVSPDGVVKILYQGELYPGKYLNVPLPIPSSGINGNIIVTATCCIACDTDPQESAMYTKAGITIKWTPNSKGSQPFFKQQTFATEAELRADAGKWESTLHNERSMRGSTLNQPAFELHYSARDAGANAKPAISKPIKYAFVVTIKAPKSINIFGEIINEYSNILTEIEPQVEIPIQIR